MPLRQCQLANVHDIVQEATKPMFGEQFVRKLTKTITDVVQQENESKYKNVFNKLDNKINCLKSENDKLCYAADKLQ